MVSLPEELQAREAAARQWVEELQSEAAELAVRLEKARADLSRLEITRETVAQVLAELSAAQAAPEVEARDAPEPKKAPAPHGIGVMAVPPWRDDNLLARIAEAECEGWLGEIEGLQVSLAGARDKIAQIGNAAASRVVELGMPDFKQTAATATKRGNLDVAS